MCRVAADGYIPTENFEKAIDEQTQLVAITHVCFRNGAKLDIPGIVRLARAKGAMVLLDCYQSVGSLDIDVKALDVDFAAGGMLKYLLGTAGHRLSVRAGRMRALAGAHQQRLVCAGQHRRDGHHREPSGAERAPLRSRHAAGRQLLRRRGRAQVAAQGWHAGDRKAQLRADAALYDRDWQKSAGRASRRPTTRVAAPPSPCPRATARSCPRNS